MREEGREEGREGRGKGARKEGNGGGRRGEKKKEGNDAKWNEATFYKVFKCQNTSLLTSALCLQV